MVGVWLVGEWHWQTRARSKRRHFHMFSPRGRWLFGWMGPTIHLLLHGHFILPIASHRRTGLYVLTPFVGISIISLLVWVFLSLFALGGLCLCMAARRMVWDHRFWISSRVRPFLRTLGCVFISSYLARWEVGPGGKFTTPVSRVSAPCLASFASRSSRWMLATDGASMASNTITSTLC
jgi:hypothetical protein